MTWLDDIMRTFRGRERVSVSVLRAAVALGFGAGFRRGVCYGRGLPYAEGLRAEDEAELGRQRGPV